MGERLLELMVGIFMVAGVAALVFLALKVSGLTNYFNTTSYEITAKFDDVGNLKPRSPVKIAGVVIGQVKGIVLDRKSYRAVVTMQIYQEDIIPEGDELTASILTAGLLGESYIGISPGFEETYLKAGDVIPVTHSALVLENLIGQLLFSKNKEE